MKEKTHERGAIAYRSKVQKFFAHSVFYYFIYFIYFIYFRGAGSLMGQGLRGVKYDRLGVKYDRLGVKYDRLGVKYDRLGVKYDRLGVK